MRAHYFERGVGVESKNSIRVRVPMPEDLLDVKNARGLQEMGIFAGEADGIVDDVGPAGGNAEELLGSGGNSLTPEAMARVGCSRHRENS